jgi:hypothetical protein
VVTVERSEMQKKIREDDDFIHSPRHNNSLKKFLAKNENPLEDSSIARVLLLTSEEVEQIYQESIAELRKEMVENEEIDT